MKSFKLNIDSEDFDKVRHLNYVNFEINPIHDMVNNLYEHMVDNESDEVVSQCNKLIHRLSLIKRDFKIK